ncbi:hypothetical protein BDZ85DRAFT_108358 [Elsinoe ampelina]|uniref:Uncharacterized protein n=1 Tax=Elsinoe ampelina TaxID=302913 RepID=A0A6A6GCL0_9PEZI|nr:hypothetical protein BDZ85DRAFT_108358 [Elsinoe ampelina]
MMMTFTTPPTIQSCENHVTMLLDTIEFLVDYQQLPSVSLNARISRLLHAYPARRGVIEPRPISSPPDCPFGTGHKPCVSLCCVPHSHTEKKEAMPPSPRPTRSLAGTVSLITGAGSAGEGVGNGRAAALLLAEAGSRVVCVDVSLEDGGRTRGMVEVGASFSFPWCCGLEVSVCGCDGDGASCAAHEWRKRRRREGGRD